MTEGPVSSVAGVADPGRGTERLSERFFWAGGLDSNECIRIRVLRDVAWGPIVKTGASVPSYSGGFAAWLVVLYLGLFFFCSWGR